MATDASSWAASVEQDAGRLAHVRTTNWRRVANCASAQWWRGGWATLDRLTSAAVIGRDSSPQLMRVKKYGGPLNLT